MAIYFVSDFHLGERDSARDTRKLEIFDKFLDRVGNDLEQLVIVGDLFDFWFEYKYLIPKRNLSILFRLHELVRRSVTVSYVCGNHDFWIGDFMSAELGFGVHRDQLTLDSPKGKILVIHGDGVAPSDYKYRLLKRVLRNRPAIALYRQLPTSLAYKLAHCVSGTSRQYGEERPSPQFVQEYHEFAKTKFAAGYYAVVTGHIHWLELKEYDGKFYVNCGDWLKFFSYVRLEGATFELNSMI